MDDRFKLIEKLGELSAKAYMFGRMYNIDAVTELTKDINELIAKVFGYSPWHTGTPTEDGYYLCHVQFYSEDYESDEEGYDIPYWFKNGSWEGNDENVRIIAWQEIEPYKED